MQTINIDVANLAPEYDCGECGEANATKLKIDISSMAKAQFYVVVFKNSNTEVFASQRFYAKTIPDNIIELDLWSDTTKTNKEYAIVEGYNIDEQGALQLLDKSQLIYLHFFNSIYSGEALDTNPSLAGLYAELQAMREEFQAVFDESALADQTSKEAIKTANEAKATADSIKAEADSGKFNDVDDSVTNTIKTWSSQKILDEMTRPQHNTMIVTADVEGVGYKADHTASEIKRHADGGGVVILRFNAPDGTGEQSYNYETYKDYKAIFRRPVVGSSSVSRIIITIDDKGNVNKTEDILTIASTYLATCYDEAEPQKTVPNKWYIPKTMPKPNIEVGTMIAVQWVNGRVDGIGYDIQLIWGKPDGVDNEILIDKVNTTGISGVSIPTAGTVTYQLTKDNDRFRFKYVSGELLYQNYSSNTAADVADKVVSNLDTNYLPGMEIYLQLDNGNTAEVMNIVPSEGATLPVYGNGLGAKTGDIEKGYILHLKNAGNYWQILNGGGSSKPSGEVWETIVDEPPTTENIGVYLKDLGNEYKKLFIKIVGAGTGVNAKTTEAVALTLNHDTFIDSTGTTYETNCMITGLGYHSPFFEENLITLIKIECDDRGCHIHLTTGTYYSEDLEANDYLQYAIEESSDSYGLAPYPTVNYIKLYKYDSGLGMFKKGTHIVIKGVRA